MKRASQTSVFMPNSEPIIQCSNSHCGAFNEFNKRFCKQCKTPVIKRYLWAINDKIEGFEVKADLELQKKAIVRDSELPDQELIKEKTSQKSEKPLHQRYYHISDRIFLDTQPGETPQNAEKLPRHIVRYLQLFSYFPHIPQVYGQLDGTQIWLLDYGTVPVNKKGQLIFSDLLPEMTSVWDRATSCQQLNWLRQIVSLWQPLAEKEMTATLLNPNLIRVNSSFIQLLELEKNSQKIPNFQDLGKLWRQWSQKANANIQGVLIELSQQMEKRTISRVEEILMILERASELCSQFHEYSYESFALSDSGPKRSNNQDKAYPLSDLPTKDEDLSRSLTIVCDGVGGHEGGEIASQETVNYLRDRINNTIIWDKSHNDPNKILQQLFQFTNEANDLISQRNDSEKRQDRQRMGTTLVMALAHHHEVFLSHVGDSRIYLITSNSCHQLTTDDDLASREVRLGYAFYRDALKYPSAGALIQALGMRHSAALHPNLQRLIVDDDCLFLLCSDGLSDFDRVEQYWRDVIAPVLEHQSDLTTAVQRLVKIGNERNGHDNVTAALVHCQIKPKLTATNNIITWHEVKASLGNLLSRKDEIIGEGTIPQPESVSKMPDLFLEESAMISEPTRFQQKSPSTRSPFFWLVIIFSFAFTVSLGLLIYAYTKDTKEIPQQPSNPSESLDREQIDGE